MDEEKIRRAIRLFLEGIGENPDRPGLKDTPARVAKMCGEIYAGMSKKASEEIRVLDSQGHDEIIFVRDIPLYSICEHHLLPFIGVAHVAYIPHEGRITGLSKLARVVDCHAKRPQIQERLTTEIAETIMGTLEPRGVLVIIEAEHLCMSMRGVKKPGSRATTSVVRGIFRDNPATRAEAMSLLMRGGVSR